MKRALGKKFTAWLLTGCITVASVFTVWAGSAPQPQEFDENGNEIIHITVSSESNGCRIHVGNGYDQTQTEYISSYQLTKDQITITKEGNSSPCEFTFESRTTSGGAPEGICTLSEPDFDATYTVSITPPERPEGKQYIIEMNGNSFTPICDLPEPVVTFGEPDAEGKVSVTIDLPESSVPEGTEVSIYYSVNNTMSGNGTAPVTFTLTRDSGNDHPTKTIEISVSAIGFGTVRSEAEYTFAPQEGEFTVKITPVDALTFPVEAGTTIATISTENAVGDVHYTVINSAMLDHLEIVGNEIKIRNREENWIPF